MSEPHTTEATLIAPAPTRYRCDKGHEWEQAAEVPFCIVQGDHFAPVDFCLVCAVEHMRAMFPRREVKP